MVSLKTYPRFDTTGQLQRNFHGNNNMPLYKLHDAPRAGLSFGNHPVTNAVPSNPNRMPPHGSLGVPPSKVVPLQRPLPKSPQQQQPTPPAALSSSVAAQQAADSSPDSSDTLPERPALPTLQTAHFGHSLYFIEHLFPSKLWRILDDAEKCGYADVISWVDDGMAFQIHDRERVIPILEKYFSMSKYKSFLRQLQAYGFKRELPNPNDDPTFETIPKKEHHRGKWKHELFRRDKMNLCNKMTRDGKKEKEDDNKGAATIGLIKKEPDIQPRSGSAIMMEQQAQQQQQLQFMHNRMLQQQQQRPPLFHQDPRFPRHHPPHSPFHQQHMQQRLHPDHSLPQVPHHHPPAPGSILVRMEQQQKEEHHRRQLQLQMNQVNEQQLFSRLKGAPTPASQTLLTGIDYNKPHVGAASPPIGATKGATEAVSEAANELQRAEMAIAERRCRLVQAQERAQKEAEALAKAEAAIVKARRAPSSSTQALAAQSTTMALLREHSQSASAGTTAGMKRPSPSSTGSTEASKKRLLGGLPLTSILEDLDNAFLSSANGEQQDGKKGNEETLKISDDELLRARAKVTKPPKPSSAATTAVRNPITPAPSAAEREVIMARINAMEQIRMREQQQMGRQQLLMKIGKQSEQGKKADAATVRDAIRHAGFGLVGGDVLGKGPSTAATTSRHSSGLKGMHPASSTATPPGILSKEMMDIFAKTAAAAISGKKRVGSSTSSPITSQTATSTNSRTASPTLVAPPTIADAAKLAASVTSKSLSPAPPPLGMVPAKTTAPKPTVSTATSHMIDSMELEAARAMMKIPGTIEQTSKQPLKGHWELVPPEELRNGTPLAKALPAVVRKSSDLTYDAYKALSHKLTPPKVMKIPEGWDATKEPVYLVVDPAKLNESAKAKGVAATAGLASS